MHFNSSTF